MASASLTVVEMSTVGPTAVTRLASALPPPAGLLDAPVLGSLAQAESGSPVIFAGGPAQLVGRVSLVLVAVGSVMHLGDLGAGATGGGMPAVVVGSPERIPFNIAREALAGCARIGVVGDHLTADIEGAQRAGLDAMVLTGATSQTCLERAPIPPDLVLDSLAALPEAIRARA